MIGRLFSRRGTGMATSTARRNPGACLQALGLSERPFCEARHGFLLARSETAGSALEQLLEKCRGSAGDVLLVTPQVAEIQRPLSALLAHELEEELLVVGIQADLLMGADEVLERIAEGLSAATGQPLDMRDMVAGLFDYMAADESCQGLVVQIEDAHELGADVIDVLLELAGDEAWAGTLRLLLWGESYLWESLEYLLAERGMPGARVDIAPFTREDISDYLEHCLVECGYAGDFPFSDTQLEKIFLESRCVPHMIDALADDELEAIASAPRSRRRRGFSLPLPHALAAGALLATLGVLYVWQDLEFSLPSITPGAGSGSGRIVVPIDTARLTAAAPAASGTDVRTRAGSSGAQVPASPATDLRRAGGGEVPVMAAPVAVESATGAAATGAQAGDVAAAGLAEQRPSVAASPPPDTSRAGSPGVDAVAGTSSATASGTAREDVAATAAARSEESTTAAVRTPLEESQARLRALPAEHYFLQLMGTFSEQSARDFIASNGNGDKFHYFRSEYQGRPWYVVVYGGFPTRQQAAGAVESLPEALSGTTPWVRSGEEIRLAMVD